MKTVPSPSVVGGAVLMSLLRHSLLPRDPAYPSVSVVCDQISRCDVEVEHVHARPFDVVLHRPDRDRTGAVERRIRERRVGDHGSRRRRRIRHGDDQVLVTVGVVVQPVSAAERRTAVAKNVPREPGAGREVVRRRVVEPSQGWLGCHQIRQRRITSVNVLRHRRRLIPQAAVHREIRRDLEVVLQVGAEQRETPVTIELGVRGQTDEIRRHVAQEVASGWRTGKCRD